MQSVDQDELSDDHCSTLEVNRLPAVVIQVLHVKQTTVDICCSLGQEPLEIRKEGRIVQRPF
jgi:hypothetical protein